MDWARQMLDLSDDWRGVIQDTASTSTLVALIAARERASGFSLARGGLQGEPHPLVVYVSAESHSSVEKAALLAGFGRANLRSIPTDAQFAMRPDALAAAIADDRANARLPCAIVATTGTTASTALDPLDPIATIAKAQQIWLHVDAAMAGSAMILPECRWMWAGVEGADSLVVNAHKWLGAAFDCSLFFVRDPQHLVRVMSTNPSYLQSGVDARVTNYRDWGIPLGRRFRALKLWALVREQGVEGLRARLRRDLDNARWLERQIVSTPRWRLVAPAPLQTLCVRHDPAGLESDGGGRSHPEMGGPRQPFRRGVPDARHARRTMDGAHLHWRAPHRTRTRRAALGDAAAGGHAGVSGGVATGGLGDSATGATRRLGDRFCLR